MLAALGGLGGGGHDEGRSAWVAEAAPPRATEPGETTTRALFITNRAREADSFGGERGELHYGSCEVAFKPIPGLNKVSGKLPFYVPSDFQEIAVIEQAEPGPFWEEVAEQIGDRPDRFAVFFVHGYNFGFDRACRRAAELQRSLPDTHTVILFTWPSDGNPANYTLDQSDLDWSVPALAATLAELIDRAGSEQVHVVAHSMGTRGVVGALQRMGSDQAGRPLVNQLVLLAPDYDSQTFVQSLPRLLPLAARISVYASDNDAPLKLSRAVNGYPRLGEAGEFLTLAQGIEVIDVSGIGRYQYTGHEYYFYHPVALADLITLVTTGQGAGERPNLRARARDGNAYWEMALPDQ